MYCNTCICMNLHMLINFVLTIIYSGVDMQE